MFDVCWWGWSGGSVKVGRKKGLGGGYDVLKQLRNNVDKSVEGGKKKFGGHLSSSLTLAR